MTNPITPPPELVEQWMQAHSTKYELAREAAQWGADQELEACIEWMSTQNKIWLSEWAKNLGAARRPKPPSLKEQALETLKYPKDLWSAGEVDTIRRALEALPND
jgi:hypothetical protein